MAKVVLGIDLRDDGTTLAYYGKEEALKLPTVICRSSDEDGWLIGEDAYEKALTGSGVITDKLLTLALKDGSSTIFNTRYHGCMLLKEYLKAAIDRAIALCDATYPDEIVVTIEEISRAAVTVITGCLCELGYPREHVHVISTSESFIYYVMSQKKEISNNIVGMFYLSDISLTYYEMKVQRGPRKTVVYADNLDLDEGFNLNILSSPSGAGMADRILMSCAERLFQKKVFSAVFLTGKGFESQSWAPNFMRYICNRRKVYVDPEIFARGAGYRGVDFADSNSVFNFSCICDGRISAYVKTDVVKGERSIPYPLANVGSTWYDIDNTVTVMPDGVKEIEITIVPVDSKRRRKVVRIPLDFLPKRPPKTTKVSIHTTFTDVNTLRLEIKDEGLGELFLSSGAHVVQEVGLWD